MCVAHLHLPDGEHVVRLVHMEIVRGLSHHLEPHEADVPIVQ